MFTTMDRMNVATRLRGAFEPEELQADPVQVIMAQ